MNENLRLSLVFIFFGLAMLLLGTIIAPLLEMASPLIGSHNNASLCNNLSLEETSYCLNDDLYNWYNYNLSNKDIKFMSEDQLKTDGGVCHHYALWYKSEMKSKGFNSYTIVVKMNSTLNHEFAVASDESGYCILDQLNVRCITW